ncbi:MAG: fasciclin domain-containing protein [Flavobacterium sp.]|nr:fasciclin domain-containing protein [Flavobacterium sp.]
MKLIIKSIALIFCLSLLSSCSKTDELQERTITNLIDSQPNLSIFKEALIKTDVYSLLKSSTAYTVFAPSDLAFTTFLTNSGYTNIDAVPTDMLTKILLNHIVVGAKTTGNFMDNTYVKTLATKNATAPLLYLDLYVGNTGSTVKLNGTISLLTPNIVANNGILHTIDTVIKLPTVFDQIVANPKLSTFKNTITSAGQPNFAQLLSASATVTTAFVPTDDAFNALNVELPTTAGLSTFSTEMKTKLIYYQLVNGYLPSALFTNNLVVATEQTPQTFIIQKGGTLYNFLDQGNRSGAMIVTDIQCTNGVIHLLDKVMLPNFN